MEYFLNIMGILILHHHYFKTVVIIIKVSLNILKVLMMMQNVWMMMRYQRKFMNFLLKLVVMMIKKFSNKHMSLLQLKMKWIRNLTVKSYYMNFMSIFSLFNLYVVKGMSQIIQIIFQPIPFLIFYFRKKVLKIKMQKIHTLKL